MLLKSKLEDLKKKLKTNNVLANLEERYCYSNDASNNIHDSKIPDLVVFVETKEDVLNVVNYANKHKIPIIPRGAGTNMVGACVCNKGGIVLNFSKMNKILEINIDNMYAKVQPGVVLGNLKEEVEKLNLFYPPDPSNLKVSTIGGSIAQSSAGALSYKYGSTKDYIISLTVITAEGEILKLGSDTKKDSMGYHLNQLFVGSEGTLGIVVEATLKLIPKPEAIAGLIAGFDYTEEMISFINQINTSNISPAAIDFMDKTAVNTAQEASLIQINKDAQFLLFIQFDGNTSSLNYQKDKIINIISKSNCLFYEFTDCPDRLNELWSLRRISYATTTRIAPDVISDDLIVPKNKLCEIIDFCNDIIKKYKLKMCLVGHIGDGNIHPQIALDMSNEIEFRNYQSAKSELYKKVKKLGGSISSEHGIGLDKMDYIEDFLDNNTIMYMKKIKKIFDPNNILNPGKIFK